MKLNIGEKADTKQIRFLYFAVVSEKPNYTNKDWNELMRLSEI